MESIIVFFSLAFVTLLGLVMLMAVSRVLHMIFSATLTFIGLAAIFFVLGAPFLGVVQIIVYVGAVTILAVFSIMLTRHDTVDPTEKSLNLKKIAALIPPIGFFAVMYVAIARTPLFMSGSSQPPLSGKALGEVLFSPMYVLSFELMGVLLLGALIAAVFLAKE